MQENSSLAAAPWQLSGEGYVVAVWQSSNSNHNKQKVWRSRGQVQLLIFAHYQQSDVDTYDEILHIPNLKRGAIKGYPSIAKIYVSSMASVINGQKIGAFPKSSPYLTTVALSKQLIAMLWYSKPPISIPLHTLSFR